jgi:Rrf2 family protein
MNGNTRLSVGAHVLSLLAGNQGGAPLTSEYIAGSVNTNPVVIRRVLGRLKKAGMVTSRGGAKGGWELIRPAASITLRSVLDATERAAPLLAMHRDAPNPNCEIGAGVQRALRGYYDAAEEALKASLGSVTIAQLLEDIRES